MDQTEDFAKSKVFITMMFQLW